jgi:hypothetical protein
MKRPVIFSPYNRFYAIAFQNFLLLRLKYGPPTVWGKRDRRNSALESNFPFNPMDNNLNDETRATLGRRKIF